MSDESKCHICGKEEYADRAGDVFMVQDCDECQSPTCELCAEVDYDCIGDPPHFVCCKWTCGKCLKPKCGQCGLPSNLIDGSGDCEDCRSAQAQEVKDRLAWQEYCDLKAGASQYPRRS